MQGKTTGTMHCGCIFRKVFLLDLLVFLLELLSVVDDLVRVLSYVLKGVLQDILVLIQ